MFKIEVYSARSLNSIPGFRGPARSAARSWAGRTLDDDATVCVASARSTPGTMCGEAPRRSPGRRSSIAASGASSVSSNAA